MARSLKFQIVGTGKACTGEEVMQFDACEYFSFTKVAE